MFDFGLVRQIVGLVLVTLSLLDPFSFGVGFKIVAFILGFDMMGLIPKIIIFGIDYFWNVSGFGLYLLAQVVEEIIFYLFTIGRVIELIIKPAVVFIIIFLNGFGFWLAAVAAIVDFILNWQRKIV